jgi:dihydrofolate reductase
VTAPVVLVLARAENGVIGASGALPWGRLEGDLPRFKNLTMGKPCIMGRKTWDSLPKKPLPGRTNIVVTRSRAFAAEGAVVVHSFDEALAQAKKENPAEIMVIGGAEIFAAAMSRVTRIHLTEIHAAPQGDVRFPSFAPQQWRESAREDRVQGLAHSYVTLDRKLP